MAAVSAALYKNLDLFLNDIVPVVLKCFTDHDNKVRFHSCEALFNIAKVARSGMLKHFNDIFDGMCKLAADTDNVVKNANALLDRLMK